MHDSQLKALRATLAAALQQVEAMMATREQAECPHPLDKRIDKSTMGEPRFQCKLCRQLIEGEAA